MPMLPLPDHGSETRTLRIEGALTIDTIAQWHRRLLAETESPHLHIDATGVTDCDTLGIQLLVAVERAAAEGALRSVTTSPALERTRVSAGIPPARKGGKS